MGRTLESIVAYQLGHRDRSILAACEVGWVGVLPPSLAPAQQTPVVAGRIEHRPLSCRLVRSYRESNQAAYFPPFLPV
jgi:hypothetical protein